MRIARFDAAVVAVVLFDRCMLPVIYTGALGWHSPRAFEGGVYGNLTTCNLDSQPSRLFTFSSRKIRR